MRLRTIVPLVLFSASVVGQDYWCLNHSFRVYADYGYIRRQDVRNLSLVNLEENKQSSKTVIDNEDLEERLGWESAIRGGIVYNATACNSWKQRIHISTLGKRVKQRLEMASFFSLLRIPILALTITKLQKLRQSMKRVFKMGSLTTGDM